MSDTIRPFCARAGAANIKIPLIAGLVKKLHYIRHTILTRGKLTVEIIIDNLKIFSHGNRYGNRTVVGGM